MTNPITREEAANQYWPAGFAVRGRQYAESIAYYCAEIERLRAEVDDDGLDLRIQDARDAGMYP